MTYKEWMNVHEPETVDQVFEWVMYHIRKIPPPKDEHDALQSCMSRATLWEGAARKLAKIADRQEKRAISNVAQQPGAP